MNAFNRYRTATLVYGVVYSCDYFCCSLFSFAILHLQTLPYQNQVVAIFPQCMYGCHFEFKMADLYRDRKINKLQSSWKACDLVRLIIRFLKMYGLLICPMFRNGVMGQNVKRPLTFAFFGGSKMTLIKISRVLVIYQIVRMTPGIPEMNVFTWYLTRNSSYGKSHLYAKVDICM